MIRIILPQFYSSLVINEHLQNILQYFHCIAFRNILIFFHSFSTFPFVASSPSSLEIYAQEREESDVIHLDRSVQRHGVTSLLETARSLVNGPSWRGVAEGEVCILRSPGIAQSHISLFLWEESVGEV